MPAEQRQAKGEKKGNNFRRVTAEFSFCRKNVKSIDFQKEEDEEEEEEKEKKEVLFSGLSRVGVCVFLFFSR